MPTVCIAQNAANRRHIPQKQGCVGLSGGIVVDRPDSLFAIGDQVHPKQWRLAPHIGLKIRHQQRRAIPFPECRRGLKPAAPGRDRGNRSSRHPPGEPGLHIRHTRAWTAEEVCGKQSCLHLLGNFQFMSGTAFSFVLFSYRTSLIFYRLRHLVEADQCKSIPVDIFEAA